MIRLVAGSVSLVGRVRSTNEDSLLVSDDLLVVADGMGGHLAGEVASARAVETLGGVAGQRSLESLVAAVHLANRRINERAAEDEDLRGMGTTVCSVAVVDEEDGEHLAVVNVGDSRVYLLADGELTRLTEDHSLVETLVREGRITAEDAEVHPQRNVLTRALGVEALVVVDAWLLHPCDGDRLLLCSDGLFNELSEDRIAEILAEGDEPEITARRLAAEADAAGGRDNISAVVVDVYDTGNPPEPLGDRYRRIATPTVDPDDLDHDRANDTATVPMVPVSPPPPAADDGDSSANVPADELDADGPHDDALDEEAVDVDADADAEVEVETASPDDEAEAPEPEADDEELVSTAPEAPLRTWRTPLFILAVLVVVGVALGIVVYYSGRGWFLGPDRDVVAVYRGRPDQFLWFEPNLVKSSEIRLEDLPPNERAGVESHRWYFEERSRVEARLERLADSTTTTTTSTTTTTTTTTTVPPVAPPDDAPPPPPGAPR